MKQDRSSKRECQFILISLCLIFHSCEKEWPSLYHQLKKCIQAFPQSIDCQSLHCRRHTKCQKTKHLCYVCFKIWHDQCGFWSHRSLHFSIGLIVFLLILLMCFHGILYCKSIIQTLQIVFSFMRLSIFTAFIALISFLRKCDSQLLSPQEVGPL